MHAQKTLMPADVKPMSATLIDEPFNNKKWLYEIKLDGYRAVAEIKHGEVNLHSRKTTAFNEKYPDIVNSLKKFKQDLILDGEIVVLDDQGRSQFQLLQNIQRSDSSNLFYYVFDLLYFDGYDLRSLPLIERKKLLKLILPELAHIRYCDHIEYEGIAFYQLVQKQQLEGIMAKNMQSHYHSGKRTRDWLKIKVKHQQEAVIAGYTKPRGSRKKFGALVLGAFKNKDLIYIGHTGTGFSEAKLQALYSKLSSLKQTHSAFKNPPKTNTPVTWVKPKLVCEIKFSGWTDKRIMREPVFIGLREDKAPESVIPEIPLSTEELKKELVPNKKENNNKINFTHINKIYFPDDGYTKEDIISYYKKIAKFIMPYLKERPQNLHRHPEGIHAEDFFQKDIDFKVPDSVATKKIFSKSVNKNISYIICNNEATLLYLVNLGCIEINPWLSRQQNLEYPDYAVLDLDPLNISFDKVIETALIAKNILDQGKVPSFCKTSGATGMHVYIPLGANYNYAVAQNFIHLLAKLIHQQIPDFTSLLRLPAKRNKKIYLDYLQNKKGQTIVAPYSLRPIAGAPVSTPLQWQELKSGIRPADNNIKNIFKRLERLGDLFKGILAKGIDIEECIRLWRDKLKISSNSE